MKADDTLPIYCGYLLFMFIDKRNWLDCEDEIEDVGLKRVIDIVKIWLFGNWLNLENKPKGDRKINQYTFKGIEVGSKFSNNQLKSMATFIWMISQTKVVNTPSDHIALLSCWECTTGAINPINGRYRTSYSHHYLYNYDITARIMNGKTDNKKEWSHLCKNSLCVRPSHLFEEDHATNINRNSCPANIYNPFKKEIYVVCKHIPRCLNFYIMEILPMSIDAYFNELK